MTQLGLDYTPPVELVQRIGPTPEEIRRAQKPQTVKVLRMLQEMGPAGVTTGEFMRAYIGRAAARIAELRAVGWEIRGEKLTNHAWRFTLVGLHIGRRT